MKIYEVREKDSSLLCARYGKEERKMKFAFLIMGDFHAGTDHAEIRNGDAQIIGVADLKEAIGVARRLQEEGIDCIELCGAFGEAGARAIIWATGNRLPVGYITHLPEQDDVYRAAFSK